MTSITAIDPGPERSAVVTWDGERVTKSLIADNYEVRRMLRFPQASRVERVAIEMVACYGMAVGKEVFDTARWIGRFQEVSSTIEPTLVYRSQIKMHFCHSMRAKDANVRQAILDRFGGRDKAIGRKHAPGPLYGLKSHLWSALAIALYIDDQLPAKLEGGVAPSPSHENALDSA